LLIQFKLRILLLAIFFCPVIETWPYEPTSEFAGICQPRIGFIRAGAKKKALTLENRVSASRDFQSRTVSVMAKSPVSYF
jgi:hypothetical protein